MDRNKLLEKLEKTIKVYQLWKKYKNLKGQLRKKKKNREINKNRDSHGYYKVTFLVMKEVDSAQFFIHTRMNKSTFELLLSLVSPRLQKKSMRKPVEIKCHLAFTLLYLSQGCSFQSLAWSWKLGKETVRIIIYETCDVIWDVLSPTYVTEPNLEELKTIVTDFWNL